MEALLPKVLLHLAGGAGKEDARLRSQIGRGHLREDHPPHAPLLARILDAEPPPQRIGRLVRPNDGLDDQLAEAFVLGAFPADDEALGTRRNHRELSPARIRVQPDLLLRFCVAEREREERQRLRHEERPAGRQVEQVDKTDAVAGLVEDHAQLTGGQDLPGGRHLSGGCLGRFLQSPFGFQLRRTERPPPGPVGRGLFDQKHDLIGPAGTQRGEKQQTKYRRWNCVSHGVTFLGSDRLFTPGRSA
ncbi:MAG: hypothetical protein A2V98_02550 [Planctomycetes bacterium RBG_16_64_12]|nr:MAG: hypothetical protein A2V98_02550 [Planctomycetes bacterium RBG_16_64_12]